MKAKWINEVCSNCDAEIATDVMLYSLHENSNKYCYNCGSQMYDDNKSIDIDSNNYDLYVLYISIGMSDIDIGLTDDESFESAKLFKNKKQGLGYLIELFNKSYQKINNNTFEDLLDIGRCESLEQYINKKKNAYEKGKESYYAYKKVLLKNIMYSRDNFEKEGCIEIFEHFPTGYLEIEYKKYDFRCENNVINIPYPYKGY